MKHDDSARRRAQGALRVTILQYRWFHYRFDLLVRLRAGCRAQGINLVLGHGGPSRGLQNPAGGALRAPWPVYELNYSLHEKTPPLIWPPREPTGAWLARGKAWLLRRMRQGRASAPLLAPCASLTVLEQSMDNHAFERDLAQVTEVDLGDVRRALGLSSDHFVAVFSGALRPDKRLDLLFEIGERLYCRYPNFRLLLLGDGQERPLVEAACARYRWMCYLGAQRGAKKASRFKLGRLMLCPGAVGLNLLDAMVAGLPLITLSDASHGEYIAFLRSGINGFVVSGGVDEYVECVAELMRDEPAQHRLSVGARATARELQTRLAQRLIDDLVREVQGL